MADVKDRYYRSKVGIVWAPLSIAIFVGVLSPIYAELFAVEVRVYALHLLLGLIVWNFLFASIIDSGREFAASRDLMVTYGLGYSLLVMRTVWRNFIVLAFQFIAFVAFSVILANWPSFVWLSSLFALFVVLMFSFGVSFLMAIAASRFRDTVEIINNLFRLLFFATPIMWMPALRSEFDWVLQINPFYYLIELVRSPLVNQEINRTAWMVSIACVFLVNIAALGCFARYRKKIAFWL